MESLVKSEGWDTEGEPRGLRLRESETSREGQAMPSRFNKVTPAPNHRRPAFYMQEGYQMSQELIFFLHLTLKTHLPRI